MEVLPFLAILAQVRLRRRFRVELGKPRLLEGLLFYHLKLRTVLILFQLLAGFLAAFGGRRTELGQQALKQILGMRKFMTDAAKPELQRLLKANPSYFHEMLPYALALGVDKAFARQFGRDKLAACPYLTVDSYGGMTARQWNDMLRQIVEILDDRQRKLALQKIIGK